MNVESEVINRDSWKRDWMTRTEDHHLLEFHYRDRITLCYSDKRRRPYSWKKHVEIIGRQPNGWMHDHEVEKCKNFKGNQKQARELIIEIEKGISGRLANWRMYQ